MANKSRSKGSGARLNPVGEWLAKALADGKARLFDEAGKQKIKYEAVGRVEIYDDPEEWVRADFWALEPPISASRTHQTTTSPQVRTHTRPKPTNP